MAARRVRVARVSARKALRRASLVANAARASGVDCVASHCATPMRSTAVAKDSLKRVSFFA